MRCTAHALLTHARPATAQVVRVQVTHLQSNTYFARIVMSNTVRRRFLDATAPPPSWC